MDISGKVIVLGVSGGIAAYRACDLTRELYRRGARQVIPVLTENAEAFVSPLTLQALSMGPIYTDNLGVDDAGVPLHIALAQQGDALLIVPATSSLVGRLAAGIGDDLLTTTFMTFTDKPVVLAPAMNTRMWRHPLFRRNLDTLLALPNVSMVAPTSGLLACGEQGEGHLADQESILRVLYRALHPMAGLFRGMRCVVTAGGTREPVDPVRFLTNRSSGKMGLALADELDAMGASVTLLTSQDSLPVRPYAVEAVESATQLQARLLALFGQTDLTVMCAAVADFRPAQPADHKLKRAELGEHLSLSLTPNPDILAELGQRKRYGQWLIGFAAESRDLAENAQVKLRQKNLDLLVANDISREDIGFHAEDNEVTLMFASGHQEPIAKAPKAAIARQILQRFAGWCLSERLPSLAV
jgi:phosphopantothenoylcysteine decarboxylase/phosphopantothenate--cysteine ligase